MGVRGRVDPDDTGRIPAYRHFKRVPNDTNEGTRVSGQLRQGDIVPRQGLRA